MGSTDSEIGPSQGDKVGKLFTLNLAGAMVHIRAVLKTQPSNSPIADNHMPFESGYSDDVEKFGENIRELLEIFQISKNILRECPSLFINDTKTKFTRVYLEEVGACDELGNDLRGNKEWRNEWTPGSWP